MKKLLSILASVGLTTTAAISVVACSTPQDDSKIKDRVEPKTLEKSFWIGLETTAEGHVLSQEDQNKVEKRVIAALKAVNQNVVIEEDTFTVLGLTDMKTDSLEVKVEVKETNSTVDQPGLKAKNLDLEVKFTLPQDKDEVSNKIREIASQTLIIEIPGKEIKSEDVQKQILTELKEFELGLEFKQTKWEPIIADEKDGNLEIKNGTLSLNVYFSGDDLNKQFEFSFMSQDYTEFEQVNQVLTKIKENPIINLSNLEIKLGNLGTGTLQDILNGIGAQVFAFIPDKIPAHFDETDEAWTQWQEILGTIKLVLKQLGGIDIDEKMSLSLDLEFGAFQGKINLEITISKLLTAILPDLVHFRHFLIEQVKLESDNLLLLLIQYLFEKPRDIENDGFASLNQTIPNVNKPKEVIIFNTNLERFVHDLLHGWQTAEGIMWKEDQNNNLDPVSIQGELLAGLLHVDFKYQRKEKSKEIAIFELLPIENIKSVITQLFNYDLNQSLNLELKLPFGQEEGEDGEIEDGTSIPLDLDLGSLIKSNLKNILKIHPDLKDQLDIDNFTFAWKKGTLQTKILNSENEWIIPQEFDQILTAKDLRVDFIAETLDVKYSDLVVTLKDIHLTFNLDLKASWLVPPILS